MRFEDRLHELTPDQRELFELFLKKERLSVESASRYRGPADATENALVTIWSELLGVEPGIDDNYFELGGDSITIIRMVSRARSTGIRLEAAWVFSHPTIAELAALSRTRRPDAPAPAHLPSWEAQADRIREGDPDLAAVLQRQRARPIDAFPLTRLQQGILFHALDDSAEGSYVVQWKFRLEGRFDLDRFRAAWRQLVERHDALRTIFQWVGVDEPLQIVLDRADATVVMEDRIGEADREALVARVFEEERCTPFDFRRAPLMRIRFVRVADDEWLCFWTHHHLILDGWSQQVVLEELFALYRGLTLPPAASGVLKQHVHWQRSLSPAPAIDFWQRELETYAPPPQGITRAQAGVHTIAARSAPAEDVRAWLKRHGVTLSVLYQTAWSVALSEIAGQADVVCGVVCAGRSSGLPGIERAVGLFVNTLPFRVLVDRAQPFADLARMVQERQARLAEHEWCGLRSVQDWIRWDPQVPLFESLYVYERFPLDLARFEREEGLRTSEIETTTHEHYPLVLVVQDGEAETTLTLKHTAPHEPSARLFEHVLDAMAGVSTRLVRAPSLAVGDLLPGLPDHHHRLLR